MHKTIHIDNCHWKPSFLASHCVTNYGLAIMALKLDNNEQLSIYGEVQLRKQGFFYSVERPHSSFSTKKTRFLLFTIFCRRICGFSTISSSTQSLPDGYQQSYWRLYCLQNNFSRSGKVIL